MKKGDYMKKMINIVLILGALALLYQFFVLIIMNKHKSTYSIKTDDNSYMIDESFNKNGKYNMYYFLIKDKDNNTFVYSYDKDINKQSRIITDVLSYKNDNLYCIAPVFKNNEVENIICNLDNNLVSYSYLKQIGDSRVDEFINSIKQKNYNFNSELEKESVVVNTSNNISTYSVLDDDLYMTMWGYNGIYILNNGEITFRDLLTYDTYFNKYSILIDRYYITANTDNDNYNSFYVVNIKDGGKALMTVDFDISKNIYFNGVYKDILYVTDMDNRRQFTIDPKSEKIEEIGKSSECKFYNGEKLVDVDIRELLTEKKYFSSEKVDDKLQEKYQGYNILEFSGNYYYLDNDGGVYQIVGNNYDYKILLFKFSDFKDLKIENNNIYGISGDTVYIYNSKIGLKKAATNRELLYNSENIYDIYQK